MLSLLIYLKHAYVIFGVVKMLCLIGQPTLPESETNQSVLCLMNIEYLNEKFYWRYGRRDTLCLRPFQH